MALPRYLRVGAAVEFCMHYAETRKAMWLFGILSVLESAILPEAPFDTIFAINVNCFWLRADEPLAAVRRLLKPDGMFYVFYEHPTAAKMRDVAAVLRTNLVRAGLTIRDETATGPVYALASTLTAHECTDMAAIPEATREPDFPRSVAQHVDFSAPRSTNR